MKKTMMIGMLAALLATSAGAALANGFEVRADLRDGNAYGRTDVGVGTWFGNTFGFDTRRFQVRDDRGFGDRSDARRFDQRRAYDRNEGSWGGGYDGGWQDKDRNQWRGADHNGWRSDDRRGGWRHTDRWPAATPDRRW